MEQVLIKKMFNPEGDDSIQTRRIINGNTTNIFNLNNVRYLWANQMYRTMMANFWIPEKVDLSKDKNDYFNLTQEEGIAYDGILSFLIFLDSIQTNNLPNISGSITAPEINLLLAIQTFQEAIHSQSYQYIIESIVPVEKRNTLYDMWRDDEILFKRNKLVADIYQAYIESPIMDNFVKVIVSNFLLEAIYFYNGFNFFYLLASRNKMLGTSDIIRLINRDELSHVVLFKNIITELQKECPQLPIEEIYNNLLKEAVELEIQWTHHIIGDTILGITKESTEQYTRWLANDRSILLGYTPLYPEEKNPYTHLMRFADVEGSGEVKSNFFEGTVTAYNMSSAVDGWEDF
ncbi:MAG: ribonucleotide-diphosphate reductase subunit beta [Desulfovibrionaceae bacterium]|nr:ribonucleotide-diphosphate reductase subunit beta [Desulfovibrionaceae bacterium]